MSTHPMAEATLRDMLVNPDREPQSDHERQGRELVGRFIATHNESVRLVQESGPEIVTGIDGGVNANAIMQDIAGYERSVCGGLWHFPEEVILAWKNKVANIPNPGPNLFFFERTRAFFKNALLLRGRGLPINPVTMARELTPEQIDAMGGLMYSMQHADFFFALPHTIQHINALVDAFRARHAKHVLESAIETTNDKESLNNTITLVNEQLTKLLTSDSDMITPTADLLFDTVNKLVTADGEPDTIPSAFRRFAETAGDYQRGQITLIGAPPGNGKTAWIMQEIECSLMHGFTVDAFLLESSFRQFTERSLMRNAVVDGSKFKSKFFTQDELRRIHSWMERLTAFENRLHLSTPGGKTATDIDAMIQQRKAATGLPCDLIVVDHLKRMRHVQGKGQSTYDAVNDTLQHLSDIAARENAALILCDQLTVEAIRNSFTKDSKFPGLGAFRGGTITEYAKVVVILHKDEQEMLKQKVVEQHICIPKANDGAKGAIPSLFLQPLAMHIEDCDIQQRLQYKQHLEALGFPLDTPRKAVK